LKEFLQKKYIIVDSKKIIRVSTEKNNIIVSKIKNDNAHKKKILQKRIYYFHYKRKSSFP
jgi:HSP20 family molecular chaperone IbpA